MCNKEFDSIDDKIRKLHRWIDHVETYVLATGSKHSTVRRKELPS